MGSDGRKALTHLPSRPCRGVNLDSGTWAGFMRPEGRRAGAMFAAMGMVSSIKTRSLPSWLKDRYQKQEQ